MADNKPISEQMRTIRWRMSKEDLRFADEIRIIPRGAFYVAIGLFVLGQIGAVGAYKFAGVPDLPLAMLMAVGVACGLDLLMLTFVYVNRDAKRRGMNSTLWTLLVICVPYFIGLIVYFLVREPRPYNCPECGATVSARFNFCPTCKHNLRPTCPQCKREVRPGDRYCPHCAFDLTSPKAASADPVASPAPGAPA